MKGRRIVSAWVLVATATSVACAGVKIYSDPKLTSETGIVHYAPKPYLLVTRTGAKDKPVDFSIIYLPDLEKPSFAKSKSGWGTSKLSLKLSNGILTEFGTESDSKGPETLTAAAGLIAGLAGAFKTTAEGIATLREEAASREQVDAAAKILDGVVSVLRDPAIRPQQLTPNQLDAAANAASQLEKDAALLRTPQGLDQAIAVAGRLGNVVLKLLEQLSIPATPPQLAAATTWNSTIESLKAEVNRAIELLKGPAPSQAAFELYEIKQDKGLTQLIPVNAVKTQ